jgi:glutamate--cysteine ligase catalytic subunit
LCAEDFYFVVQEQEMGLLKVGKPLAWDESKRHSSYVRHHGLIQFINVWNRIKDIHDDKLRWGDEVECG